MRPRRKVLEGLLGAVSGVGMRAVLCAADLPSHLEVGDASIDVYFDSDPFDLGRAALLDWVMQSARAATVYFGRFPVTHAPGPTCSFVGRARFQRGEFR